MSKRGENIRKRKDGRWEGRYLITLNGCKKYRSVYGHTYREVKQKVFEEKKRTEEINILPQMDVSAITLDALGQMWLLEIQRDRKYSTYQKYGDVYQKHIKEPFGSLTMEEINSQTIEKSLPKQLSQSMYKSVYSVLNQILLYGTQHLGTLEIHLKPDHVSTKVRPVETLNLTEQQKLLTYLLSDLDSPKLGILISLFMGLRLGEVCALKWEDIDFQSKTLHVNRTVQRLRMEQNGNKTVLWEGPPKTLCSLREIPIPDFLFSILVSWENRATYVLNKTSPMDPRTYQYKFRCYLREAGVKKTHFHTLRHTFATNCISNGADVKSVWNM